MNYPPTPTGAPLPRRNNYDKPHSDLEVVPDDGANYDKVAIPTAPHAHYDKFLVPPQPYYQKEVVEHNAYPVGPYDSSSGSPAAVGSNGNGDTPAAAAAEPKPSRREKILGLRRKTFFILVWAVSIAAAVAIGVGAGVGASSRKSGNDDSAAAAAAAAGVPTVTRSAAKEGTTAPAAAAPSYTPGITPGTAFTPATNQSVATETVKGSTPSTSAPPGSTSSVKVGGVGGRCVNQWGADCVCLDSGICTNVWRGTPYTGYVGNWPCPNDPDNVMACVVKPCLGRSKGTQCLWKEACREVSPVAAGSAPICPGDAGGDFVCCAHEWV